jgi:hypothetical protein
MAVATAIALAMFGPSIIVAITFATWSLLLVGPLALRLWRLSRTTYALTERRLYTFGPGAPAPMRITGLPRLIVVDEEADHGSIAFVPDEGPDRGQAPRWLGLPANVIVAAIPDPDAVLALIQALRGDATSTANEAAAAAMSGTDGGTGSDPEASVLASAAPTLAPRSTRSWTRSQMLPIGISWTILGGFMVATAMTAGLGPFAIQFAGLPAILTVAGVASVGFAVAPVWRARRLDRSGQGAIGTVSRVTEHRWSGSRRMRHLVEYRYEVLGRRFTGRMGGLEFDEAHRVGVGDAVLVRFDPAHPERSVWAVG